MHERNIYKTTKRSITLAEEDPHLRKYVIKDKKGRKILRLRDPEAIEGLAKVLLRKDFGLTIEFPVGSLIPTIPSRLNYIHWIEDLIDLVYNEKDAYKKKKDQIHGIDIGTGGSAIYTLLATKMNGWRMVGTEINEESITYARQNVENNGLTDFIKVVAGDEECLFSPIIESSELQARSPVYDFSMCNPPFYDTSEHGRSKPCEDNKRRKKPRPQPSNARTGKSHELETRGGEMGFVNKMIKESAKLKGNVKIFTTLLGMKSHLGLFRKELENTYKVTSSCNTIFQQGKTARWGLAWTFQPELNLGRMQ